VSGSSTGTGRRRRQKGEALDRVVQELRDAILAGRLEPGERIYQETIAAECGTSRQPVREALRRLENEGLVVTLPNAGARVASLQSAELHEVYWLRERLEPAAIARSAELLSDEELAELRRLVEQMESIDAGKQTVRWLEIDQEFHWKALVAAALPRLDRIIDSLWNLAAPYRRAYATSADPEVLELANVEHRLLLDALERRNGEDAAAVLAVHIRRTRLGLDELGQLQE